MRNKRSELLNLSLTGLIFVVIFLPIAVSKQSDVSRETKPVIRFRGAHRGLTIQYSMVERKRLMMYLNLSNDLNGMVSRAFVRLKSASETKSIVVDREDASSESQQSGKSHSRWFYTWLALILAGIGVIMAIAYFGGKKMASLGKNNEKPAPKPLKQDSLAKLEVVVEKEAPPPEAKRSSSELVFFVGESDRFELDDLLEATADLRSHSVCSTLYKVGLKNNMVYAVKRLSNLLVSFEDFGEAMRRIGNVKHRNILPLVAYSSTPEDKLLIYKYHDNGSLLNLLEDCVVGKREFQWAHRLSIAGGIARGLTFIYSNKSGKVIIPHGNIKPSNILVDESDEPLIGEFGHSILVDRDGLGLCSSKGYAAPERALTEKSDVYSFGVVLLELLTGKIVERSTFDLPKWVNAMIREEWTGEVFGKNLARSETQWAFPLLNVALKCVSYFPENRPTFAEVLERIEELYCAEEDHVESPMASVNESQRDCCVLHSIIPETWDSPGSNY